MSEVLLEQEAPKQASVNVLRYIAEELPVPEINSFRQFEEYLADTQIIQIMCLAVELHGATSPQHNYEKTLSGEDVAADHITRPFFTTVHNKILENEQSAPYLLHAYASGGEYQRTTQSMLIPLELDGSLNGDEFARNIVDWSARNKGTVKLSYYINNMKKIAGLMARAIEIQIPPPETQEDHGIKPNLAPLVSLTALGIATGFLAGRAFSGRRRS